MGPAICEGKNAAKAANFINDLIALSSRKAAQAAYPGSPQALAPNPIPALRPSIKSGGFGRDDTGS